MKTIKTASLFSGIGAPEFSISNICENKNLEHNLIFGCDIDSISENMFTINHNPHHFYSDVYDIEKSSINYELDFFHFSPVCK